MADPEQEQETQDQEIVEQSVRDTEDELLKDAFEPKVEEKPEAKAPEKVEATQEPSESKPARERDPTTGKFVRRDGDVAQPLPQAPEAKQEDEVLPSWRAREINEERRQAQAELERMRSEHARLQAWAAQVQRQQQPQKAPEPPDPVLDPAAYTKFVQDGLRAEYAQQRAIDNLNFDLRMTHRDYGDRFEKAYEALVVEGQRGNHQLVRHLTSQASPGEAIMRWFTTGETLREVGPDVAAYKQKTREQLLDDPEFLAQAEARLRERAMGNSGQQKPNTVVRMPPSLSKATGSSDVSDVATDGSEAALFNFAMNSKRR